MEPIVKKLIQADLHQITTAWSEGRVTSPEKVKNLAAAMAQEGQQVPLVAVAAKDQLMLLDGYARLDAARQVVLPPKNQPRTKGRSPNHATRNP